MYSKLATYVLHNLHVQFTAFQSFIFILDSDNDLASFIFMGNNSHVCGPYSLLHNRGFLFSALPNISYSLDYVGCLVY